MALHQLHLEEILDFYVRCLSKAVCKFFQSWLSASPFQYKEGFTKASARTVLADNALPPTQQLIGEEKGLVAISFVLQVLSVEVCQSRLSMPDAMAGGTLGGSI